MSRSLRLIPVLVLSAVALAACGSSQNHTVPSLGGAPNQQAVAPGSLAAARAAVACARKHGMPSVPDPVLGANGQCDVRRRHAQPDPRGAVRLRGPDPRGRGYRLPTAGRERAGYAGAVALGRLHASARSSALA